MIDIHTHLLPGVDDGSDTWDESLALIRQMAEEGITGAVCTPHVLSHLDPATETLLSETFGLLRQKTEQAGLPVKLWLGTELYYNARFDLRSPLVTLNHNGKYLLFEFPMNEIPKDGGSLIFNWIMDGFIPILAHPERNQAICRNPEIAAEFIQRGVLMQMDAGSLLGIFGRNVRRAALKLIDYRLIHFVASDYHHPENRPAEACRKAYAVIARKWGEPYAKDLFYHFPESVLLGRAIQPREPVPMPPGKQPLNTIFEGR
jgi:protein-tyrosine phosphatase